MDAEMQDPTAGAAGSLPWISSIGKCALQHLLIESGPGLLALDKQRGCDFAGNRISLSGHLFQSVYF